MKPIALRAAELALLSATSSILLVTLTIGKLFIYLLLINWQLNPLLVDDLLHLDEICVWIPLQNFLSQRFNKHLISGSILRTLKELRLHPLLNSWLLVLRGKALLLELLLWLRLARFRLLKLLLELFLLCEQYLNVLLLLSNHLN